MAGIDQEISMRMNAANNNPQLLMQRYAQQGQNVLDLLSAQLLNNQNKAAENSVNAMFQDTPPVVSQLEQENAQSAQREVVNALRPGLEMQGQQMANQGIASNPVNNMGMADGGIVGFATGGPSSGSSAPKMGSVPQNTVSPDQLKIDADMYQNLTKAIANASTPEIKARNQMLLQNLITKMTNDNTHGLVMQYIDSMEGMVQPRAQGMAGGGVVALKEGGILNRIMNYIRNIDFGGTSREADQFNREVMQALNERNMGDSTGIMALRNIEPEEIVETETMYVPSRAEQFSQMFPGARRAINEAGGSEEGGMKYLQMMGEMQERAEEDEARRALNYIKMMAGSQDMIDDVDPAVNIPTFAGPEGSLVESDTDAAYRERTGRDRPRSAFEPLTNFLEKLTTPPEYIINEAGIVVPNPSIRRSGEEIAETLREREARMADIKEDIPGLSLSERAALAGEELLDVKGNRDIVEEVTEEEVIKGGPVPTRTLPPTPLDKLKSVTMGQATGGFRAPKEVEKEEGGIDIRRLQAFLAGGAGQASTAGALGGGLRGLMAEDQRAEKMALTERDLMGRIGASRYGAELDYRAAIASLDRQDREMIYKADRELEKQYVGAEQSAARDFLKEIEDDQLFNLQFMRLQSEFEGAALAAETAALKEKMLDDYMGSYRRGGLREDTGSFGYTAPSE